MINQLNTFDEILTLMNNTNDIEKKAHNIEFEGIIFIHPTY